MGGSDSAILALHVMVERVWRYKKHRKEKITWNLLKELKSECVYQEWKAH